MQPLRRSGVREREGDDEGRSGDGMLRWQQISRLHLSFLSASTVSLSLSFRLICVF